VDWRRGWVALRCQIGATDYNADKDEGSKTLGRVSFSISQSSPSLAPISGHFRYSFHLSISIGLISAVTSCRLTAGVCNCVGIDAKSFFSGEKKRNIRNRS